MNQQYNFDKLNALNERTHQGSIILRDLYERLRKLNSLKVRAENQLRDYEYQHKYLSSPRKGNEYANVIISHHQKLMKDFESIKKRHDTLKAELDAKSEAWRISSRISTRLSEYAAEHYGWKESTV